MQRTYRAPGTEETQPHAKDTPNFVGNRIGVFSILSTMYHAERLGLGFDPVDALTGPP